MLDRRNQIDKIIITAMDRFVWFVLLVVMSHLVTEFTRVTGYARGPRHDVVLLNDTSPMAQPRQVQNLVLYPGQEFAIYQPQGPYNNYNNYNHNNNNNNNNNNRPQNAAFVTAPTANGDQQGFSFSFRPLIDSIFEIPISTLRAVNNLVARLTGGFQQSPSAGAQKSPTAGVLMRMASEPRDATHEAAAPKKSLLREEVA